ncbi:MAG: PEP-CTERM sorting domain-containing protein [Akkermansiaceae bacterium]
MKIRSLLLAATTCGLSSFASAFTLDFTGFAPGTPLPLTVNVLGYGDVNFSAVVGTPEIGTFSPPAGTPAIGFENNEAIQLTFTGAPPVTLAGQYIGADVGIDTFTGAALGATGKEFLLTFTTTQVGGTAGLQSVEFTVASVPPTNPPIPEPSTSLLGAIGAALLVVRRKR